MCVCVLLLYPSSIGGVSARESQYVCVYVRTALATELQQAIYACNATECFVAKWVCVCVG